MVYRSIGIIANAPTNGIDISLVEFQENGSQWSHTVKASQHIDYGVDWDRRLQLAPVVAAVDYNFLHTDMGTYIGNTVNQFIDENHLQFQASLISYLGMPVFYQPGRMIAQLGHGAAIAQITRLPVVTDLPALDILSGGSGKFFQGMSNKLALEMSDSSQDALHRSICVALMGVIRWREEYNFLSSLTGANRNTIGGCVWLGGDG